LAEIDKTDLKDLAEIDKMGIKDLAVMFFISTFV
jgi:hypothetical protein